MTDFNNGPTETTLPTKSDTKFYSKNIILSLIALVSLTILFMPYFKSGLVAFIFFCAGLKTRERMNGLTGHNKTRFYILASGALALFVALLLSASDYIFSIIKTLRDPDSITKITDQVYTFAKPLVVILQNIAGSFLPEVQQIDISDQITKTIQTVVSVFLNFISTFPMAFLQLLFFSFIFYTLTKNRYRIHQLVKEVVPVEFALVRKWIAKATIESGFDTLTSTAIVALTQGTILSLGALFVGLTFWPMIFLGTTISSLIPVVGIMPIAVSGFAYVLTTKSVAAASVFAVFAIAASIIDNVLRSLFISKNGSSLHPIASFFGVIGGILMFGFSGLFIGPFLLMLCSKIFKEIKPLENLN